MTMTLEDALALARQQADEAEAGVKQLEEHPEVSLQLLGPQAEQQFAATRRGIEAIRVLVAHVELTRNGRPCEACEGRGELNGVGCPPCYGTGVRFVPREEKGSGS